MTAKQIRERARWAVAAALKSGRLRRGSCELASEECSGPVEAHHDDHSRPLVVRWLCRRHHRPLDGRKMARRGGSNGATRRMYERLRADGLAKGATKVQPGTHMGARQES